MKIQLPTVTLIGIDCVDLERLKLAADISAKEISFGAVKLLSSIQSDDPRVVKIPRIKSRKEYSDLMIKHLNEYIDTEFALVFQYDGFVLNPGAWSDDFLKYDYIGAPWYHLGNLHVGNGGFSLRSKKLLDWLAKNWRKIHVRINPEDIFISKFARPYLEKDGIIFAPENIASKFCMEGNEHSVVWNGEFGVHGIKYTDISNWLAKNPEYKNKLTYKLDDYSTLMKKYPVYDGTVRTFRFHRQDMKNYKQIAEGRKNYELRLTKDGYDDLSDVKEGNTAVFKRSGVELKDTPIPAFERKIKKVESFDDYKSVRNAYPKLFITYPKHLKKFGNLFIKLLGSSIYPKDKSYNIFWFD